MANLLSGIADVLMSVPIARRIRREFEIAVIKHSVSTFYRAMSFPINEKRENELS